MASASWRGGTLPASDFSPATAITLAIASRWPPPRSPHCRHGPACSMGRRVINKNGLAVFDLIRGQWSGAPAVLCAFDLLEIDGDDLRREPIETRKSTFKSLLRGKHLGIVFNPHTSRGWRDHLPGALSFFTTTAIASADQPPAKNNPE
jgi:hypothetical protein